MTSKASGCIVCIKLIRKPRRIFIRSVHYSKHVLTKTPRFIHETYVRFHTDQYERYRSIPRRKSCNAKYMNVDSYICDSVPYTHLLRYGRSCDDLEEMSALFILSFLANPRNTAPVIYESYPASCSLSCLYPYSGDSGSWYSCEKKMKPISRWNSFQVPSNRLPIFGNKLAWVKLSKRYFNVEFVNSVRNFWLQMCFVSKIL